ncbi:hypothetical protein DMC47_20440 [Nostoc sp. 3335mG]|nr:hypothetical protein DMC47_20440 [Nostoc sp. 3335mG]
MIVLPPLAIAYNGIFAAAAAAGAPMNNPIVIVTEIILLGIAFTLSFYRDGLRREDMPALLLIGGIAGIALLGSLVFERPMIEGFRNVLIIAAFTVLGIRYDEKMLRIAFALSCLIALGVLLIEINNVETYAAIFRPADYLSKTRGYAIKEFMEETGLAIGTIAYSSRFSFGLYDGPRTSSIFLEQVSINCFSIVLMVYLCTMWQRLSIAERVLTLATVVLIVVTNNARMSSILAPLFLFGYWIFPRLPRYWQALIPVVSLAVTFLLFAFLPLRAGDDLLGRIGTTYRVLTSLSADDILLGSPEWIPRTGDTGYGFVIASMGLIGGLMYWAYLTIIVPQTSAIARRAVWGASLYIYIWLLIGGTGTFSMKSAPLLWLLLGYCRATYPSASGMFGRDQSAEAHRLSPRERMAARRREVLPG